ncbi:MAG: hypothetical protein ACT4P2_00245, partial [Pseudomonadota bacterium]
ARALAVLATAAGLAGCGGRPPPPCPSASILAEAATVTRFRDGPGRDLTDVINEGELFDILALCSYGRRGIDVDLQVGVVATRGPADRARAAQFEYFVAILDPERQVVARQRFDVRFEFPDNRARLVRIEELEPQIPLADAALGPRYEILVGFQLTRDELAWNRSRRPSP